MTKWLLLILLPSFAVAKPLSLKERRLISVHLALTAETLAQNVLPTQFTNAAKNSTGRSQKDKALVNAAIVSWSKNYSKKFTYQANGLHFTINYGGIPLLSYEITGSRPTTLKLNDKTKVTLKKGQEVSDFLQALKKNGYEFDRRKVVSLVDAILPQAYAEGEDVQLTFENSIVLGTSTLPPLDDGQWFPAPDANDNPAAYVGSMIEQGVLYPQSLVDKAVHAIFGYKMSCNAETASGKIWMDGSPEMVLGDFIASRTGGVTFEVDGMKFIGKHTQPGAEGSPVKSYCWQARNLIEKNERIDYADYLIGNMVEQCKEIMKMKPALGLKCEANNQSYKDLCKKMDAITVVPPQEFKLCLNAACDKTVPVDGGESAQSVRARIAFQEKYKASVHDEVKRLNEMHDAKKPYSTLDQEKVNEITRIVYMTSNHGFAWSAWVAMGTLECCNDAKCRNDVKEKTGMELAPETPAVK